MNLDREDRSRRFLMLNEYHLQFLRHLVAAGPRFLIVGGQARFQLFNTPTRDLDIWVDCTGDGWGKVQAALVSWGERYQIHTARPISAPLDLRPGKMIRIPDDDVWYLRDNGEPAEIGPRDGIDVLTSIKGCDFADCYSRAVRREVASLELRFLSEDDLVVSAKG